MDATSLAMIAIGVLGGTYVFPAIIFFYPFHGLAIVWFIIDIFVNFWTVITGYWAIIAALRMWQVFNVISMIPFWLPLDLFFFVPALILDIIFVVLAICILPVTIPFIFYELVLK